MDTETFDELPRRLSDLARDGPGSFSMDLVIEKLLAHCRQPEIESNLLSSSSEEYVEPKNLTGIYSLDEGKSIEGNGSDSNFDDVTHSAEESLKKMVTSKCDLSIKAEEQTKRYDLEIKPLSEEMSKSTAESSTLSSEVSSYKTFSYQTPSPATIALNVIETNEHALKKSDMIVSDALSSSNGPPPTYLNNFKASALEHLDNIASDKTPLSLRPRLSPIRSLVVSSRNSVSSSTSNVVDSLAQTPARKLYHTCEEDGEKSRFGQIDLPPLLLRPIEIKDGPLHSAVVKIKTKKVVSHRDDHQDNQLVPSESLKESGESFPPKSSRKDIYQLSIDKILNGDKLTSSTKVGITTPPKVQKVKATDFRRKLSCTSIGTDQSYGLFTSQQSTSSIPKIKAAISATTFRRHERSNRHESVAIDLGKGVETYSFSKLIKNVLLLWLVFPFVPCVIVYGIIPYDNLDGSTLADGSIHSKRMLSAIKKDRGDVWGVALIPFILVLFNMGALAVEIYSKIITEIEYGVLIIEDTPKDYFHVSLTAVIAGMGSQALMFAIGGQGLEGNWLVVILCGFIAIAVKLRRKFINGKSTSIPLELERERIFRQTIWGLFFLLYISSASYTIFAIIYTLFSGLESGIFLAILFPFLRFFLVFIVEQCPGVQWGFKRGNLCAGYIVTVIAAAWNGAFCCLIVGCASEYYQLITLAVVEAFLQVGLLVAIGAMPDDNGKGGISNGDDDSQMINQERKSKKTPKHISRLRNLFICANVYSSSNIMKNLSKDRICNVHSMEDGKVEDDNFFNPESPKRDDEVKVEKGIINEKLPSMIESSLTNTFFTFPSIYTKEEPRTVEHDSREVRLATFLSLTWISGVLTPITFLLCCLIFSIGPNRKIFGGKILGGHLIDSVGFDQIWSLNFFSYDSNGSSSNLWYVSPPQNVVNNSDISSMLVKKLIGVTVFHLFMLLVGYQWLKYNGLIKNRINRTLECKSKESLSCLSNCSDNVKENNGISTDIFGLISALLEYNYNLVAFTVTLSFALVFCVIFPWSGMNSSSFMF